MAIKDEVAKNIFGSNTRAKLFRLFLTNPDEGYYVRQITRLIDEQINSVRRELNNLEEIKLLTKRDKDNKLYYKLNPRFRHLDSFMALYGQEVICEECNEPKAGATAKPASKAKKAKPRSSASKAKIKAKASDQNKLESELAEGVQDLAAVETVDLPELESTSLITLAADRWPVWLNEQRSVLDCLIFIGNLVQGGSGDLDLVIVGDNSDRRVTDWMNKVESTYDLPIHYACLSPEEFRYRLQIKDQFVLELLDQNPKVVLANQPEYYRLLEENS